MPISRTTFESAAQFRRKHGLSRSSFYRELASGRLKAHKMGAKLVIFPDEERRWREQIRAREWRPDPNHHRRKHPVN